MSGRTFDQRIADGLRFIADATDPRPDVLAEVRALCEDQIANDAYDHYGDKRALVDRILDILDREAGR